MPEYRYLIVGGGMTADAACRGIRDHDADGTIGLVGAEPDPPYNRPPLSKALWQGKDEATVWRGTAELGVELHLGAHHRRARPRRPSCDRRPRREATGTSGSCSRPAAARGGSRRRGGRCRLLPDAARLPAPARAGRGRRRAGRARRRVHRLRARRGADEVGRRVTQIFPEDGIAARVFPPGLAAAVTELYRSKGVDVRRASSSRGSSGEADGRPAVERRRGRGRRASSPASGSCRRPSWRRAPG